MISSGFGFGLQFPRTTGAGLLGYVTDSLVGAWVQAITSETTQLVDKNGKIATLYSGRFVTTDENTDKAINADCSALGSGAYRLTGKVRSSTTGTKYCRIGSAVTLTVSTADVWEDFETSVASGGTPSSIVVGWDGGSNFSACDWSDVKLVNPTTGAVYAHWPLTESGAADLDGKPAFDASGNDFHGTHTGCAGGTGETTILQTAGQDWNKRMWFDGVNDAITFPAVTLSGAFEINFKTYVSSLAVIGSSYPKLFGDFSFKDALQLEFFGATQRFNLTIGNASYSLGVSFETNTLYDVTLERNASNQARITANGVVGPWVAVSSADFRVDILGSYDNNTRGFFNGLIYDLDIDGQETWDGTLEDATANGWTVNGLPTALLIPSSDTIPTEDAFGNAIANPRINAQVFNGFDSDQYLLLPDDSSLESVRSVTLAIYNDAGTKDILVAAGGASFADIAGGTLQSDQTTSATYVNGEATTTLAAGWNIVSLVFDAGKDLSAGKLQFVAGSLLAYGDKALTAQEVAQNHNYFASSYGLAKVDIPEVPEVPEGPVFTDDTVFTSTSDVETTSSIVGALEDGDVPANTKGVVVGTDVTTIDGYAFYEQPLETVAIHDGVTAFGISSFDRETPITIDEFVYPDDLASVGSDCFRNFRIQSLTLKAEQANLVGDGDTPTTLINVTFKDGSIAIPDADGFTDVSFKGQPLTGTITLPTSLTTIGVQAFQNCGFTEFTIPDHITTVGVYAFYQCAELTTINCYVAKSVVDKEGVFLDTGVTTIHVRSDDTSWTAGGGQNIGDKSGITVTKDL
jgi:hypothetical protein